MAFNKTQRDNARRYRTFDPTIDGDAFDDEEEQYDDSEDDDALDMEDEEEPEDDEEDIDATPGQQKRNTGEKRRQLPARTGRRQDNRDEDSGDGDIDHLPARQKPNKAEQRGKTMAQTYDERLQAAAQRLARQEGVTLDELRYKASHGDMEMQRTAGAKMAALYGVAAKLVESQSRKPVQTNRLDEGALEDEVRYLAEYVDGLDYDAVLRRASRGTRDEQIAASKTIADLQRRAAVRLSE